MTFELNADQEAHFDRNARQEEAKRLAPILRESMPSIVEPYDAPIRASAHLEDTIFAALERAHELRIETHSATMDFVLLWLLLGQNFDQAPEVGAIFLSNSTGIDIKVKAILVEIKWHLHKEAQLEKTTKR